MLFVSRDPSRSFEWVAAIAVELLLRDVRTFVATLD
jgi:hypothetical protein